MGELTDIIVTCAIIAGIFYGGYKYAEYKYRINERPYATSERTVIDLVDDTFCSKYK